MKTSTKIIVGFVLIILLSLVQVGVEYSLQSNIIENTRQIKDVEAPLEVLVEQGVGYDALLTGEVYVALLEAQDGNYETLPQHKERYDMINEKLDAILQRDVPLLFAQSRRSQELKDQTVQYLVAMDATNQQLVDLEILAFAAMERKDVATAQSLVVDGEYDVLKAELRDTYLEWSALEHVATEDVRQEIMDDSTWMMRLNLLFSLGEILVLLATLFVIRSFVLEAQGTGAKKR